MVTFKKTVLPNGIRVVSELHPNSQAVSLGIWATTGTRDESDDEQGLAHFLEHMVFKGTKTRSAYQIARSLEAVGGDLNAYTTKEYTCYHAMVLSKHWKIAFDVLSDIVSNMKFTAKDFLLEKGVILQEIAMSEDNHEDIVHEILFDRVYGKNPLARPILGTVKSIGNMTMSALKNYYRTHYNGPQLIVSCAGPVDHTELVEEVTKALGKKKKNWKAPRRKVPRWLPRREVVERDGEQVHCLWAFPTSSYRDGTRFEAYILNAALGGGMTSRLYQAVRERKGLVYNIHSALNTFEDCGMIEIYAGTDGDNVRQVGEIVAREVAKLKRGGLSRSDLEMYKTQLIGGILMGSDDVDNRMSSLGVNEMVFGKYRSVDLVVSEIEKIDEARMRRFLKERFDPAKTAGVALGPGVREIETWWKELDFEG